MIYYLYNDFRESVLFDTNANIRTKSLLFKKIALSSISDYCKGKKILPNDILVITGSSIPSSTHNFKCDCMDSYIECLTSFNKKIILFEDIHPHTYSFDNYIDFRELFNDLKRFNIKYAVSLYDIIL